MARQNIPDSADRDEPRPLPKPKKRRRFLKAALWLTSLLAAALLGGWVVAYFDAFPASDLTQIDFPYAAAQVKGMPVVRVFFVTTRQVLSVKDGTFADRDAGVFTYGTALVRISPTLRIGDLQMPEIPRSDSDPSHPTVLQVDILPKEKFFSSLKEELDQVQAETINLLVHGVNHSFDSSLRQAGALAFDLDMSAPIVLFAWPTVPGVLPENYRTDEDRDLAASGALTLFLEEFQVLIHPRKINIIAHSLGCKVVCECFHELLKRSHWNDKETEMENVVLAAPDVDRDDFNSHFVQDVAALASRVTVYVANNDGVLVLSSLLNGLPRAGTRDPGDDISPEEQVKHLVSWDARTQPHIEVIDATFVNNPHTAHSYYYQSRPVFSDLYSLLRNNLPASERHLLHFKGAGQANYWAIPP